jgi:alpha-ketoglutaric semialdehyde dehydrogenase
LSDFLNYIDGAWRPGLTGKIFENINPADTRDIVGRFQASGAADARAAVEAAQRAFDGWRRLSASRRAAMLLKAADYIEAHSSTFAHDLTREQGKPLALAKDEFLRCAQTFRYYAIEGQSFSGETLPSDDSNMAVFTLREPLGVVSVITPWNFPASIAARKLAPALITGNTVVFKPATDAPLSGLRLVEALVAGGLPAGVINFVTGPARDVGPAIIESPEICAISFTGSTAAGESIHRATSFTTRTQMELGGKNPLIVMDDADLDVAVDLTIKGGLSLSGQACTGTSRVLVMSNVEDAFTKKLIEKVSRLKIGAGLVEGVELGPITTAGQLKTILQYIEIGRNEARLIYGGERLTGPEYDHGYFLQPAIFTGVTQEMRIAREEIFGPVIAIISVSSYEDALAKANDVEYGLSSAIVTQSQRHAHAFMRDIEAGTVKINRPTTGNVGNAPFGGLKRSSTSTFRESGRGALEFYTQIKTVYYGL